VIASTIAQWTVAMELEMWRRGRNGDAAGLVTTGNGGFHEPRGGTWRWAESAMVDISLHSLVSLTAD
jgi:hypothetical protein